MDKYSGGNHSHHHRHFPCRKNTITCMYVDATNLFIKAQNHSLHSLKNSIIHFFFQRDVHAKRSFCWPKATKVLRYKCCNAANALSSRVIEPYFIYTVGLRGWRDCYDRCCTVSENTWFLGRCCSLHQLWKNISTLGNWDFFSRMGRHEDFTESENCACMVQINRTKKRGGEVFFFLFLKRR